MGVNEVDIRGGGLATLEAMRGCGVAALAAGDNEELDEDEEEVEDVEDEQLPRPDLCDGILCLVLPVTCDGCDKLRLALSGIGVLGRFDDDVMLLFAARLDDTDEFDGLFVVDDGPFVICDDD